MNEERESVPNEDEQEREEKGKAMSKEEKDDDEDEEEEKDESEDDVVSFLEELEEEEQKSEMERKEKHQGINVGTPKSLIMSRLSEQVDELEIQSAGAVASEPHARKVGRPKGKKGKEDEVKRRSPIQKIGEALKERWSRATRSSGPNQGGTPSPAVRRKFRSGDDESGGEDKKLKR